ncbi:HNH endonuclease [Streptomyces sp. NBC_01775]|uniref:HNH endonuclease n=1 Tax=Streptomyces sp. NBC_01775 TaxID=2975939 RepID=UPI002DDB6EEE|nr:HNH endonuclease [Streptomyces sp. NBC_01775]WSB78320.1 HNH endonuclease [Streptomyces sp. NBC_01775]
MPGNPRNGRPYRRLVDAQRRLGLPCWICGHNIGYQLDARHPLSFTLDHLVPLSRGGSLLDPANARSAHRRCNSARGNRTTAQPPARASRRW